MIYAACFLAGFGLALACLVGLVVGWGGDVER